MPTSSVDRAKCGSRQHSARRRVPHTLKEFGIVAMCDYLNDDQPYLLYTEHGPLVCVPYSNDINDFALFARGSLDAEQGLKTLRMIFDELYAESAVTGRIMNFGLHPHVMGQAHRIPALRLFLDYLKTFDDVWYPTRQELALWYLDNHVLHIPPRAAGDGHTGQYL